MYLSKFQLVNYKSFRDSGVLEFKPGINIIVGTNNSGKTALLEALSLKFQNQIHKSLITLPSPLDVINSHAGYQLSLIVERESLPPFIRNLSKLGNNIIIPIPDEYDRNYSSQFLKDFFNNEFFKEIEIKIRCRDSSNLIAFDSIPNFFSSSYNKPIEDILENTLAENNRNYNAISNVYNDERPSIHLNSLTQTIQYHFFQKYRNIIYKFDAERINLATSPAGTSRILNSDASNLAQVLSILSANPSRFERFNKYVSTIIPGIKWVSAPPYENNTAQIKVWTVDRATEREDLGYPLSDCGTGVSQVLAILYVLITSEEPRIIIIDEPQSFLHPGAAKKLVGTFKEFPQHQYFIATHSAEIIAAANPSTIVKLRYEDGETQASIMDTGDIREQRSLLAELGVSLSDVFGADSILWVEGPTEELCFPRILEKLAPKLLTGTKIVSIKNTGDLLRKKDHFANVMLDLYERISGGNNLYPPAIGFVFDKECLADSDIEDLKRRRPHPLKFIPRRMYENYLMHPDAIAFVLNQKIEEQKQFITSEEVQKWLESNKSNKDYFSTAPTEKDLSDPQWVDKHINAAKLLEKLFAHFPKAKAEFSKTTHSVMLTEWLLENDSYYFAELVDFLQRILDEGKVTVS
jgi:predicted ATPase